jgi:hypothetical protein
MLSEFRSVPLRPSASKASYLFSALSGSTIEHLFYDKDTLSMRARVKLRPGQRGTKRWLAKYGDRLVCVRYRYDAKQRKRYTTIEVIVDEGPWTPPPPAPDTIVGVRVAWGEAALARQVKAAGGQWDRRQQVWNLRYDQIVALGLLERIVLPTL